MSRPPFCGTFCSLRIALDFNVLLIRETKEGPEDEPQQHRSYCWRTRRRRGGPWLRALSRAAQVRRRDQRRPAQHFGAAELASIVVGGRFSPELAATATLSFSDRRTYIDIGGRTAVARPTKRLVRVLSDWCSPPTGPALPTPQFRIHGPNPDQQSATLLEGTGAGAARSRNTYKNRRPCPLAKDVTVSRTLHRAIRKPLTKLTKRKTIKFSKSRQVEQRLHSRSPNNAR